MDNFNEKVLEHFLRPRNVGVIENADGVGEIGSKECGDYLVIYIKVNDREEIEDIKFKIHGCVAAIATSSAVTEIARGLNIHEAVKITEKGIVDYLGGLPEEKLHCSVLGASCIKSAVRDYLIRKKHYMKIKGRKYKRFIFTKLESY